MDFHPLEHHQMLADTIGRFLRERYAIEARHGISGSADGWSRQHWQALADLGVVGALLPEHAGGFGGTGSDIAIVFEQLGRGLVVEPFLGTLMAGRILAEAGGWEETLGRVIAGACVLAFAHEEPGGRHAGTSMTTRATQTPTGWVLTGEKIVIPQLGAADQIVVSARISGSEDDLGLFLVDNGGSGVECRGYPLIDGGRGGDLRLTAAPATLVAMSGQPIIQRAMAAGITALVWEAVGVMEVLKHSTLEYLRTRRQFGMPIGAFQALRHRIATIAVEIEQARSAAINAADALESAASERERLIAAGKYTIGRAGTLVAEEAIQMHGGIGMAWENRVAHYAKRLTMIDHQLGDEDYHLARFIALSRGALNTGTQSSTSNGRGRTFDVS
ncbi:acyl-CoA dehydrogenase family protein [Sphingobium mellinum]|uniref:acyl-CoA dehydrogenase family protein n=1 Tax=Sphingobium mellinum TaxID=1387166 RepID=UPI0030ECBB86